jgi:predicted nucleic acid-binding protein
MKKIKLYLETSVWNFLFADDAPDKKKDTVLFFDEVIKEDYEIFISELVVAEIMRAPEPKRSALLKEIEKYEPEELEISSEVDILANKYAEAGFVPSKAFDDLLHVAVATVNNIDFLVSWNLSHIVRARSIIEINRVNVAEGYRELKICTVWGVLPDEN